jgi:hypothetical protein
VMRDVVDLLCGVPERQTAVSHLRLSRMSTAVLAFRLGCGLAAVRYAPIRVGCFALPPLLTLAAFVRRDATDAI